ncbi:hypothetical protein [Ramlibacter sp.]|uniref:hypothetical protein n=1 Tax=Ramlibacter sp. TaxID=1917967 RepID=UPI0026093173|nr:hypothetical protein [Ramlibacter sp.]
MDHWVLYDNSGGEPVLIDWSGKAMSKKGDVEESQPVYGAPPQPSGADLKGSLAALRRAANRARQVAQQTGTDLIVMRDGQLIRISPAEQQP